MFGRDMYNSKANSTYEYSLATVSLPTLANRINSALSGKHQRKKITEVIRLESTIWLYGITSLFFSRLFKYEIIY